MDPAIVGEFIPIVAILAGIGAGVFGMYINYRRRVQRAELRHRERMAAIEKGLELPPDPPDVDPRSQDEGRFLRNGLILVAVGVTVTAGLMSLPGRVPYLFGLVPAAIGVAELIYYAVMVRTRRAAAQSGPPPAQP
ncbi:MAG: hypothetical protein JSR54_15050 [Proteobacteria bacterium]|nr:hypothetical protein [Pseudomonadota bacterium]